jgi:hypothetical protein
MFVPGLDFADERRIDGKAGCGMQTPERHIGAFCHLQQGVPAVGQIQQPQQIHLTGTARLLLASDGPVKPSTAELRLAAPVSSDVSGIIIQEVEDSGDHCD